VRTGKAENGVVVGDFSLHAEVLQVLRDGILAQRPVALRLTRKPTSAYRYVNKFELADTHSVLGNRALRILIARTSHSVLGAAFTVRQR